MKLIDIICLILPIHWVTAHGQEESFYLEIPFENEEAFVEGALDGQQGWEVLAGRAEIAVPESGEPYGWQRHLQLPVGEALQTHIRLEPNIDAEDELLTVTVELDMAPSGDGELVPVARIYGVELAYRVWDDGESPTLYVSGEARDWIEIPDWDAERMQVVLRFDRRGDRSVFDVAKRFGEIGLVNLPIPEGDAIEFFGNLERATYLFHIQITTDVELFSRDSDGDGLHDAWEHEYGLSTEEDNRDDDLDGDGLSNIEEWSYGIDPSLKDTDFDGVDDGVEVMAGTDPSRGRWPSIDDGRIPFEPSDEDVSEGLHFEIPLPRSITAPLEQRIALLDAVESSGGSSVALISAFDEFIEAYPDSPYREWVGALVTDWHFSSGDWWFIKPRLETLWARIERPDVNDPNGDREWRMLYFVGLNLAYLYALEGKLDEVQSILEEIPNASSVGSLQGRFHELERSYTLYGPDGTIFGMRTHYNALYALLRAMGVGSETLKELHELPAPLAGLSLADLKNRAAAYGVSMEVVYREPGSELIHPSITLGKLGYFGVFNNISSEILDRESSGYFLVPADTELPEGWRFVHADEASAYSGDRIQQGVTDQQEIELNISISDDGKSLSLEIIGKPGSYNLQYSSALVPNAFYDVLSLEIVEGQPIAKIPLADLGLDLEAPEQGYFRVR